MGEAGGEPGGELEGDAMDDRDELDEGLLCEEKVAESASMIWGNGKDKAPFPQVGEPL